MITVSKPADSVNPAGSRLTSFLATYPRFIHAEMMTHRAFSRNAASSRAIPLHKMIKEVADNPALPEYWGAEQKGMQSGEQLEPSAIRDVLSSWNDLREEACWTAEDCAANGLHKSLCNRLIEPWSHITVLITASDKGLANFFALRAHPAAMPEFQVLAYRMLDLYMEGRPQEIPWGGWHIPQFKDSAITNQDPEFWGEDEIAVKIATARCARLSYLTHDGKHEPEKDIKLHDDLLRNRHLSPFEHCAQAKQPYANGFTITGDARGETGAHRAIVNNYKRSNFDEGESLCGWEQYRKTIEGENQTVIDPAAIMETKPAWITL